MLINCVICSDLFVAADDVSAAPCGHLFHHLCLLQWIERSESCPQCRARANKKNVHKVFFNIVTNGTSEDPSALQHRIDSLNFQIRLKDTDIKNVNERNELLNKHNSGLREEVEMLEKKLRDEAVNVAAMKEVVQSLRKQNQEAQKAVEECKNLRKHVEYLQGVQSVVNGTADEVEEMINNCGITVESVKTLATFVSVLRKEMHSVTEEKKRLQKKMREMDSKLAASCLQLKRLRAELACQLEAKLQLEQDLKLSDEALQGLEQAVMSPSASHPSEKALRRLIAESPAPAKVKRPQLSDPSEETCTPTTPTALHSSPIEPSQPANTPSPYLNVKSSSFGLTPLKPSTSTNQLASNKFSIFKRARIANRMDSSTSSDPEMAYDGLGGHSKADWFPRPIPKAQKPKRHVKKKGTKEKAFNSSQKDDHPSLTQHESANKKPRSDDGKDSVQAANRSTSALNAQAKKNLLQSNNTKKMYKKTLYLEESDDLFP